MGVRFVTVGRISGASFVPVPDTHPVAWLRGRYMVTLHIEPDDLAGAVVRIGDEVTITLPAREAGD